MKVALATCKKLPEQDPDETLLAAALEGAGVHVRMLAWDGDGEARARADEIVVLRSTWNYFEDVDRFLGWTERTADTARMYNPPARVRRNARKTYLRELERAGIDVVPTAYVAQGASPRVDDVVREHRWEGSPLVIKPVISAGSFLTQRFDSGDVDAAQRFLDEMIQRRDAMIQPWMPAVDTYGERALVWIDGELTHAVRKSPRFVGGAESVSEAVPIAPAERIFAEKVLAQAAMPGDGDLLYARIDVVHDASGDLCLMELELIEPSLFLKQSPHALERLVKGIVARAGGRS